MDSGCDASTYETYAILIINVLLLLERIFKNGKFFIKCSANGITFTNRTPPQSPAESQDNVESGSPAESPADDTERAMDDYEEFKRWKDKRDRRRAGKHKKNTSTEDRE
jgi:hypothetical protein